MFHVDSFIKGFDLLEDGYTVVNGNTITLEEKKVNDLDTHLFVISNETKSIETNDLHKALQIALNMD